MSDSFKNQEEMVEHISRLASRVRGGLTAQFKNALTLSPKAKKQFEEKGFKNISKIESFVTLYKGNVVMVEPRIWKSLIEKGIEKIIKSAPQVAGFRFAEKKEFLRFVSGYYENWRHYYRLVKTTWNDIELDHFTYKT